MADFTRADGRSANQLRPIRFQNHIAPYAAGVLVNAVVISRPHPDVYREVV